MLQQPQLSVQYTIFQIFSSSVCATQLSTSDSLTGEKGSDNSHLTLTKQNQQKVLVLNSVLNVCNQILTTYGTVFS